MASLWRQKNSPEGQGCVNFEMWHLPIPWNLGRVSNLKNMMLAKMRLQELQEFKFGVGCRCYKHVAHARLLSGRVGGGGGVLTFFDDYISGAMGLLRWVPKLSRPVTAGFAPEVLQPVATRITITKDAGQGQTSG